MPYGGPGVIYALSQYSPFISIPRYQNSSLACSLPQIEDESSNQGMGDSDMQIVGTSTSNISPSVQDQTVCNEPGISKTISNSESSFMFIFSCYGWYRGNHISVSEEWLFESL